MRARARHPAGPTVRRGEELAQLSYLTIEGRAWPIPDDFTAGEIRAMCRYARKSNFRKLERAIKHGDPRACAVYVLTLLRRVDADATVVDAWRAIEGVS